VTHRQSLCCVLRKTCAYCILPVTNFRNEKERQFNAGRKPNQKSTGTFTQNGERPYVKSSGALPNDKVAKARPMSMQGLGAGLEVEEGWHGGKRGG
jgi:hypothetical protein